MSKSKLPIPTTLFGDPDLVRQTGEIRRSLSKFGNNPIVEGELLEDITVLAAKATDFRHKLGRELVGWFVVDIDANAVVWSPSGADRKYHLRLRSSADCNVSVWVF